MKKNELKKLNEKISEVLIKSLPEELKINEAKSEKTIVRHLKHLLRKLNAQNLKEMKKAEKSKKESTALKKVAASKSKA
jgi:DNA-binding CsgD family transcriptional regulator